MRGSKRNKFSVAFLVILCLSVFFSFNIPLVGAVYTPTALSDLYWGSSSLYDNSTEVYGYYDPYWYSTGGISAYNLLHCNLTGTGQTGYDFAFKTTFRFKSHTPGTTYPDYLEVARFYNDSAGTFWGVQCFGASASVTCYIALNGASNLSPTWITITDNQYYNMQTLNAFNSSSKTKYMNVTIFNDGYWDSGHVVGSIAYSYSLAGYQFSSDTYAKIGTSSTSGLATCISNFYLYPYAPRFFNVSLGATSGDGAFENIDGGSAPYAFVDHKYYVFNLSLSSPYSNYYASALYIEMRLKVSVGVDYCDFLYNITSGVWSVSINETNMDPNLAPVRIVDGSNGTIAPAGYWITFKIWFTDKCSDVYDPNAGVVLYGRSVDNYGDSGWNIVSSNCFRLYSEGGFIFNPLNTGSAGPLIGSGPLASYGYNGSDTYSTIWYRDLNHIKLLPTVTGSAGYEKYQVWGEIDYSLGTGQWLQGWQFVMKSDYISYTGLFAGNVWINYTIDWYYRNAKIKTDYVYMFYHNNVGAAGDHFNHQFWIDMWFDKGNATGLGGGRINAYEYPMVDNSAAWLHWLANNWGVKDDVLKESSFYVPITDSNNATVDISTIKMVKFTLGLDVLTNTPSYGQFIMLENKDVFLTEHSGYPLRGIDTPTFDETRMPVIQQTGLLGALWMGLSMMGKWISDNILFGGLKLWPTLVAFLDTIASWLGMPHGFTNLIGWLSSGWLWVYNSFVYGITLITGMFTFIGVTIGAFIWAIGQAIVSFANVFIMIGNFLNGTVGGAGDLWNQLGISTWFMAALIFYPLYLIILWDQKGMGAVMEQLGWIWGIMSWIAHFFLEAIHVMITVISGIIEAVPVVE